MITTSSNCFFSDRSVSISTWNGEPLKKSISSSPNSRCQLVDSLLMAVLSATPAGQGGVGPALSHSTRPDRVQEVVSPQAATTAVSEGEDRRQGPADCKGQRQMWRGSGPLAQRAGGGGHPGGSGTGQVGGYEDGQSDKGQVAGAEEGNAQA